MTFSEAFAPWLPTLQDIEVRKNDVDVGDYYRRFGWENLVVPDDCPHVSFRMFKSSSTLSRSLTSCAITSLLSYASTSDILSVMTYSSSIEEYIEEIVLEFRDQSLVDVDPSLIAGVHGIDQTVTCPYGSDGLIDFRA